MRAGSVCAFTVTGRRCGRMSRKPTRRIAYADRIPNAIAPNAAQTNIAKLNQSAIPVYPDSIARASVRMRSPVGG